MSSFNQIEWIDSTLLNECSAELNVTSGTATMMGVAEETQTDDTADDTADDTTDDTADDTAGWESCVDPDEVPDLLELDDLDLVAELTHPIRGKILRRLKEPRSVAALAEAMNVPVTRLYHHVNRLVESGLIRVVATRQVAAVTERCYQVVAKNFKLQRELFDTLDDRELAVALGSLFDVAKVGFERVVESGGFRGIDDPAQHSMLSLGEITLSDERRVELLHRLGETVREFTSDLPDDDSDGTRMTLFVTAFPDPS